MIKENRLMDPYHKYTVGDEVYVVDVWFAFDRGGYYADIHKEEIEWYKVYRISRKQKKLSVAYRIKHGGKGKAYLYTEKQLFDTFEEADKYAKAEVTRLRKEG